MSHWIPGDVLMSAADMRNVLRCCAVLYLHGELGDPLAAGVPERAVSIYTVTNIDYMSAQTSLDNSLII